MTLPVLGITLGDVAGIGPEITAKTLLQHPDLRKKCVPVVVGDADAMRAGATRAGLDPDTVKVITVPRTASNDPSTIELIQTGPSLADVPIGEVSAVDSHKSRRLHRRPRLPGRARHLVSADR